MAGDPADSLFHRYRGLIGYAANMYAGRLPIVDPEDLFQDGCLWMLEFFNGRADTEDGRVHNTFKKSLFLWMRRTVRRRIKQARPRGKTVLRLDGPPDINIDRMLVAADTCVLAKLYAREFVAELRRLLKGLDLTVFDLIVESVATGTVRHNMVREAATIMGTTTFLVYRRVVRIREAAMKVLLRSA